MVVAGETREEDGSVAKPWRLCTVQQVEDVKSVVRVLPLWSSGILVSVTVNAQVSLTVLQALTMDRAVGPRFAVPAASITVTVLAAFVLAAALFDRVAAPLCAAAGKLAITRYAASGSATPSTSPAWRSRPSSSGGGSARARPRARRGGRADVGAVAGAAAGADRRGGGAAPAGEHGAVLRRAAGVAARHGDGDAAAVHRGGVVPERGGGGRGEEGHDVAARRPERVAAGLRVLDARRARRRQLGLLPFVRHHVQVQQLRW